MDARHLSLREAFDRHAVTYDETFSSLEGTRAIRQEIWQIADDLFPSGSSLLDLGCGTGDDAIHFAQRGIAVTAIDIAPAMGNLLNCRCRVRTCRIRWAWCDLFVQNRGILHSPNSTVERLVRISKYGCRVFRDVITVCLVEPI